MPSQEFPRECLSFWSGVATSCSHSGRIILWHDYNIVTHTFIRINTLYEYIYINYYDMQMRRARARCRSIGIRSTGPTRNGRKIIFMPRAGLRPNTSDRYHSRITTVMYRRRRAIGVNMACGLFDVYVRSVVKRRYTSPRANENISLTRCDRRCTLKNPIRM